LLHPLESREGPSSLTPLPDLDFLGPVAQLPGAPPGGQGQNQAPVISDFKAKVGPNGQVTFTGTVSDDQAVAGLTVRITGLGISFTAIVDEDGKFSTTQVVMGSGRITVTAQVTDALGATSDPVQTSFTP
jgi:hypothetical protein